MTVSRLVSVARGDAPADLLLHDARIINVFSGLIEQGDIAIVDGKIAGIGADYPAIEVVDLAGAYVAPGLIDAHVHIESSLCIPPYFASMVVPRGVTTIVTDPHEIANVAGIEGIRFMAEMSRDLPLTIRFMAPSCVPATHMETNGAALSAADLLPLLTDGTVMGLAEVMNYQGVVNGDVDVLAKLAAFHGKPIDGHAPALRGRELNAYVAAGVGSDHECTTVAEATEKLARGLYLFIREATNARNLHPLLPLITDQNSRRICFCTDDRIAGDLLTEGSIDYMLREAIAYGIEPIRAFQMATINSTEWFGLHDRGAVAPGRVADLMVFDHLDLPVARAVYASGELVAKDGALLKRPNADAVQLPDSVANSIQIEWSTIDLRIRAQGPTMRVIGLIADQLGTETRLLKTATDHGFAIADPMRDILKMAVIDRHSGRSTVGLGFIQGMGLRSGAIAGTVAHDHHNLVIIGASDDAMRCAGQAVVEMGGGLVVVDDGQVEAVLPLPIAGLMSDRPAPDVQAGYDRLLAASRSQGARLHDPFMAMSFLALEVIPELKLTDKGLIDVDKFEIVDLFI